VAVVYHELPGWNTSIAKVREWSDLPKEAHDYVEYIESFVHYKVGYSLIRCPPQVSKTRIPMGS
jgi:adenylosuccinate synthase